MKMLATPEICARCISLQPAILFSWQRFAAQPTDGECVRVGRPETASVPTRSLSHYGRSLDFLRAVQIPCFLAEQGIQIPWRLLKLKFNVVAEAVVASFFFAFSAAFTATAASRRQGFAGIRRESQAELGALAPRHRIDFLPPASGRTEIRIVGRSDVTLPSSRRRSVGYPGGICLAAPSTPGCRSRPAAIAVL